MLKKYNDQKLSEVLKDLIQDKNWKAKLYQSKVKEIWILKMGSIVASHTKEIKLRRFKLIIVVNSAPLKQDLSYSKDKIKDIINEGLGEEYVKEVIIR